MDQENLPLPDNPERLISLACRSITQDWSRTGGTAHVSKTLRNLTVSRTVRDAHFGIPYETQVILADVFREPAVIACFDPASILDDSGRLLPLNLAAAVGRFALNESG